MLFSCVYKFTSYPSRYLFATVVEQVRSQFSPSVPSAPPAHRHLEVQLLYLHFSERQHSPSSCGGQWK